ncbi:MAG: sensor histidine kinase [Bacteroidota bacterium]|nr:sensor histidine kinase [Bacteroidota bacterium]
MIKSFIILFLLFFITGTVCAQQNYYLEQADLHARISASRPDSNRIDLLLKLGNNYLMKLESSAAERDSSWACYEQAFSLSRQLNYKRWQMECLRLKGKFYIDGRNLPDGRAAYLQVIHYYQQNGDRFREAETWFDFGGIMHTAIKAMLDERIPAFESARKLYDRLGLPLKSAEAMQKIAETNVNLGKLDLAESQFLGLLDKYKSLGYKKNSITYYMLYIISHIRSDIKMELFYALAAKNSMLATGDVKYATAYYFALGEIYQDLGMYNDSFLNYKLSLETAQPGYYFPYRMVEQMVIVLIAEKKATAAYHFLTEYVKKHPPADSFQSVEMYASLGLCYQGMGNYHAAEKAYLQMVRLTEINNKKDPSPRSMVSYNQMIADFYVKTKQYGKAERYLNKLDTVPKVNIGPIVIGQLQLLQFKVDSAFGRFLPAINDFQAYKKRNDSIFNAVKLKQVNELQIKYETEKKDKDLLLLKKQNQVSVLLVEKGTFRQKLIAGCALFLAILLGIGYRRYREKLRHNRELQLQKEEITLKNSDLEQLLTENQWLLREVHHRVKNNLQIVMSLLNSQSAHLLDENALNAVRESRMRVQAMSLIHQKLYGCEDVATISMPEYIDELVANLKDSFKSGKNVRIIQEIAPLTLDVSQAVPVGLILNEAITNAMKYAFPFTASDLLVIKMSHKLPFGISLTITDNGRGLPSDLNLDKVKSFGLKLIKGLTEDLGGSLSIAGDSGTEIRVSFDLISLPQRRRLNERVANSPMA